MAPDYKSNDPKGWCGDPKRGAALGRGAQHAADRQAPIKFYLRRIDLNKGGYDPNGTYFGIGEPLYWCADAEGNVDFMLRASGRMTAKQEIQAQYPNARFFR